MKKIMFSDRYSLTAAVLDGSKTQTRRIASKAQLRSLLHVPDYVTKTMDELAAECMNTEAGRKSVRKGGPMRVGEEIAVAQAYRDILTLTRAQEANLFYTKGWSNKMFVAAKEMPHAIKITDVRLERLRDITDEDCLKEGVKRWNDVFPVYYVRNSEYHLICDSPRNVYHNMVNDLFGKDEWIGNPYVFVYDFVLLR